MTAGSLTLACVLLAVNAAEPPDTAFMSSGKFSLPITVNPQRRAEIKGLELHMSRDRGQSWELYAKATPEKASFEVATPGDGSFWFSIVVVDAQDRRDPPDLKTAPVGLRVFVDSVRPEIKLTADRQGEEIVVIWDIHEEHLDSRSLRVEWVQSGGLPIVAPIVNNDLHGTTRFKPNDPHGATQIRMTATDLSGNQGMGSAEVPGLQTAPPGISVSGYNPVRPPENVTPPSSINTLPGVPTLPAPSPLATAPSIAPQPVAVSPMAPGIPPMVPSPPMTQEYTPAPVTGYNGQLPPVQIVNKRQVRVEFDVAKYGPTGLGGVEVHVTTDDGQSWSPAVIDQTKVSLPGSVLGSAPLRGSVELKLDDEAKAYGFIVIVKSKYGLGKPPPRSGDLPQLRLELDTTAPAAQLGAPQPDKNQPNTLIMSWVATDRHLAANPITLEWRAGTSGAWNPIGEAALPNTGRYAWQVPPGVPPTVYLRLTVRDSVGNVAVAETERPTLVDFSVPEVSNIGLQVSPR